MFTFRRRRSKHSALRYPVLSDKPIEIHNPRRKVRIIAVLFGLAIAVSSVAGAAVATFIAGEATNDSTHLLLDDIEQKKRQRDQEATRFQAALDQYRRDQCEVTARLPQDPPVVDIRRRYRCDNQVVTPSPAEQPGASPTGTRRTGNTRTAGPAAQLGTGPPGTRPPGPPAPGGPVPRGPQPPPVPVPSPAPPPLPAPSPNPDLCLPLLGICLF